MSVVRSPHACSTPRFASLVERVGGQGSRAWDVHFAAARRAAAGEAVILLTIGDHDFDAPEPAVDATVDSLRRGRHHYTAGGGEPALRAAIARWQAPLSGQALSAEEVIVLPGAQAALFAATLCLFEPGDVILVPDPMYATYEATLSAGGAVLRRLPLRAEADFHLDPADVAAALRAAGPAERIRGLVLNTPHNPTGAVLSAPALHAIAELAIAHDLWVISDEVYATLVYDGAHFSPAGLPGMAGRTVVLGSLSKSHAMTGWRIGWAAAPAGLIAHMTNLASCMFFGQPPFAQDGALGALERCAGTADRLRALYRARRDLVCDRLSGVEGLGLHRPEGGMFVMLDVRGTGLDTERFAWRLLDEQAVALLPGEGFGPGAAGHLRLSLSRPQEELEEAAARIARFVDGLG